MVLFTWVTRSLAGIGSLHDGLARDRQADGHSAAGGGLGARVERGQRVDRGPGDVDRVGRAVDLGQDVTDPGRLHDGPDSAPGDDPGALGSRLEHLPRGGILDPYFVGDRGSDHRDPDLVLLGILDALADRLGDLAGLAQADPDVAGAITDDDDRAEAEATAALDHLRNAVDLDDTLLERELVGVDAGHWLLLPIRSRGRPRGRSRSEE